MDWIVLTLLAITARSFFSIAAKMLNSKLTVSPITQTVLVTFTAGMLAVLLSPMLGGIDFSGIEQVLPQVGFVILTIAVGNILFFRGQTNLDAGTSQIAFSSILIWGAGLSVIVLDSVFSLMQLVGIVLLLGALIMLQYQEGKFLLNKAILYIVAAALLFALFQVLSADIATTVSTSAYLLICFLGPSLLLGIFNLPKITQELKNLAPTKKLTAQVTLFASVTTVLYYVFSYMAYAVTPDRGIVIVLLTSQVILSVLLGIVLLKETTNIKRKIIAALLAFLAGVLITI